MPYSYQEGRYIHEFPPLPDFKIEKNLLTFAASRAGKGATQIIPFLETELGVNALVIDPKGEAAEATAEYRELLGCQDVNVLDPMKTAKLGNIPRARLNFLDEIDPNQNSAFRQINALSDGLIMRHDPKGGHWDGGGMQVLSGFIAHVLTAPEYEGRRSLITVRQLLKTQGEEFADIIDAMAENEACGGLPVAAANKLLNTGNEAGHFLSVATSNTAWLDDPDISECLSKSTFKLSSLKTKNTDIFLVLPFEALSDYGVFLRLFVRMALYHMQQKLPSGELKGKETYFILDEFFSLGHIETIEKSMGAMPGLNLRLWPFLQDANQLFKIYDHNGAGTFFSNSDAVYFYGVNNDDTAKIVSTACGLVTESDLGVKPPTSPDPEPSSFHRIAHVPPTPPSPSTGGNSEGFIGFLGTIADVASQAAYNHDLERYHKARAELEEVERTKQARYTNDMNIYQHARSVIGHPRVSPEQVMQITKRSPIRNIAERAIVIREGVGYIQELEAYWEAREREKQEAVERKIAEEIEQKELKEKQFAEECRRQQERELAGFHPIDDLYKREIDITSDMLPIMFYLGKGYPEKKTDRSIIHRWQSDEEIRNHPDYKFFSSKDGENRIKAAIEEFKKRGEKWPPPIQGAATQLVNDFWARQCPQKYDLIRVEAYLKASWLEKKRTDWGRWEPS